MRIVNNTTIATADLRALANRIAKAELTPETKRGLVVEYKHSRKQHRGEYWTGRHHAVIYFPKLNIQWWKVAVVTAHELHHASGREGGRSNEYWMRRSVRYGWNEKTPEYYSWVNDMDFRFVENATKAKLKKSPIEKAAIKLSQTEANIVRWEKKAKRAANALKKYRKREKYYQKRVKTLTDSAQN